MNSFDNIISQTYSDTSFHIYLKAFMDDQSMWAGNFNKNDFESWKKQEFGLQNSYITLELKLNRIDEDNLTLLVSNKLSSSGAHVSNKLQTMKNDENYHQSVQKQLSKLNIKNADSTAIQEIDNWQDILKLKSNYAIKITVSDNNSKLYFHNSSVNIPVENDANINLEAVDASGNSINSEDIIWNDDINNTNNTITESISVTKQIQTKLKVGCNIVKIKINVVDTSIQLNNIKELAQYYLKLKDTINNKYIDTLQYNFANDSTKIIDSLINKYGFEKILIVGENNQLINNGMSKKFKEEQNSNLSDWDEIFMRLIQNDNNRLLKTKRKQVITELQTDENLLNLAHKINNEMNEIPFDYDKPDDYSEDQQEQIANIVESAITEQTENEN